MLKVVYGDMFMSRDGFDVMAITTNGYVTLKGRNVMGAGCAKEATNRFPGIASKVGALLQQKGNHVHHLPEFNIVTFPVKPASCKAESIMNSKRNTHWADQDPVPGFVCRADIDLIKQSINELVYLQQEEEWRSVMLPKPGCGCGELDWEEVSAALEEIIPDTSVYTFFDHIPSTQHRGH